MSFVPADGLVPPNAGIGMTRCGATHDDVIKWKQVPRYWSLVWGIHRSPVNSPHKGKWHGVLMLSLICVWTSGWANNRVAGDLRCHRTHYGVIVMIYTGLAQGGLNVLVLVILFNSLAPGKCGYNLRFIMCGILVRKHKMYLHFLSILNIEMAQGEEFLPCGREWPLYQAQSILWLLMTWWGEEPGHQQPWSWPSSPNISWFQHQKG